MVLGLILTFTVVTLSYIYWTLISSRRYKLAEQIGGPHAYPFIGNTLWFLGKNTIDVMTDLDKVMGGISRIWLGPKLIIAIKDPTMYEVLLNSKATKDKGEFYQLLSPFLGNGLVTADWPQWHKMRKIISPTLNVIKVKSYIDYFSEECQKLNIRWFSKIGTEFRPYEEISATTLSFTLRSAIGDEDFNDIPESEKEEFLSIVETTLVGIGYRFTKPWFYNDFLWSFSYYGRLMNKNYKVYWNFIEKMIQLKKNKVRENDASFLRYMVDNSKNGTAYDDTVIKDELSTYIIAGFETTSAAVTMVLVMLGCRPEIQKKVLEEQNNIFGDSLRLPEYEDLGQMEYLDKTVKETLRLFPSVPMFGHQTIDDFKVGDFTIPKNTLVIISPYLVHRQESLFKNSGSFDPEHFSPEQEKTRHPWSFIAFGRGPRSCVGQKYAFISIKVFLSILIRNYTIETTYREEDVKPKMDMTLRVKHYPIILRSHNP